MQKKAPRIYWVSYEDATDLEPGHGWFVAHNDGDTINGPFPSRDLAEEFAEGLED